MKGIYKVFVYHNNTYTNVAFTSTWAMNIYVQRVLKCPDVRKVEIFSNGTSKTLFPA